MISSYTEKLIIHFNKIKYANIQISNCQVFFRFFLWTWTQVRTTGCSLSCLTFSKGFLHPTLSPSISYAVPTIIYYWRKQTFFPTVFCILDFSDFLPVVLFSMFVCPLHFLKTEIKSGNLNTGLRMEFLWELLCSCQKFIPSGFSLWRQQHQGYKSY